MTGTLVVHGITDEQLVKIIHIKEKSSGKLKLSSNIQPQPAPGNQPGHNTYNNVNLSWTDAEGAKFASEMLASINGVQ